MEGEIKIQRGLLEVIGRFVKEKFEGDLLLFQQHALLFLLQNLHDQEKIKMLSSIKPLSSAL